MDFACNICNLFRGNTFGKVLRHIGEIHGHDPGLHIICGLNGCTSSYTIYESFRKHVYRKHREHLQVERPAAVERGGGPAAEDLGPGDPGPGEPGPEVIDDDQHLLPYPKRAKMWAAKFVLHTKEESRLTQKAVDGVVSNVRQMWREIATHLESKLRADNDATVEGLLHDLQDPFIGLETEYLQRKFYKEEFDLLEPVERVLGSYVNAHDKEVNDCCYDIPLLQSLQSILRSNTVIDEVFNPHTRGDSLMGDYCDGQDFKQSPLFMQDPTALQVQLYYDEVELCNPIGTKAKKHKLGLFYYTLGNLKPMLRSSLQSIQLLCAVKYDHIKKYGITQVLTPIVDGILMLERDEGVSFQIKGEVQQMRGTLTVVSADNLATWLLGGYKALGSAFRRCQYCMAVFEDMQTKFTEGDFQLRTKELYMQHCMDLEGPLREHMATAYGVIENSILNSSRFFHVTGGLVPDIMHDILEGSLLLTTTQVLHHCIVVKKYFTLAYLNSRLEAFEYRSERKNKPSPIGAIDHLKQTASQMWCLGRFLPLLVGHKVPEGDQHWENFNLLLTIQAYVFAPLCTVDMADFVAFMVEEFLEQFVGLYQRPLTPKMHYMLHLPTWMKRCGPLRHLWCMRYEAKHSHFKRLAQIIGNFKNIAKTLAHRHQSYMCLQLTSSSYLQHATSYTGGRQVCLQDCEHATDLRLAATELEDEEYIQSVKSAEINGITYKKGSVLLCGWIHDMPIFAVVLELFVVPSSRECLFAAEYVIADNFDCHRHAYVVHHNMCGVHIHKYGDWLDKLNFLLTKLDGIDFVSAKYHIFCYP